MAVGGRVSDFHTPSNFSKSLDRIFDEAQITSELKLCGRKLKEFPKGALKYNLSDTVTADLSKNRFSEVPVEICQYFTLEELHLHHNVIKTLPEQLASLQALSSLILSRNQLSVLPSCVCQLVNLQVLVVSGNRLVSLPEDLGLLTKLTELDASYNQIQVLPPSIGDLDDLRRLRLRRNLLQNVPTELCFLRLLYLDLSYNQISSLPTELRFMTSLLNLHLEANPLSHPPANICMRGRVHIFKWLDQSAAKEDKKRGALSELEFRKSRKYTRSAPTVSDFKLANGYLDGRHKRSTVDSGYSTSENGDPRWSHGSQELCDPSRPDYAKELRTRSLNTIHNHSSLCGSSNGAINGVGKHNDGGSSSLTSTEQTISGHSTPSTLSPGDSFNLEDEFYKAMKMREEMASNHIALNGYNGEFSHRRTGPDGATSTSPVKKKTMTIPTMLPHPHNPDPGGGGAIPIVPSPMSPHAPVPTYREYLEAKRQQRAMESNNVYKRQGGDGISPTTEQSSFIQNSSDDNHLPLTRSCPTGAPNASNIKLQMNGHVNQNHQRPTDFREDTSGGLARSHVKNIQKEAVLSYVKSRVSSSPSSPNTSFDSSDGLQNHFVNHSNGTNFSGNRTLPQSHHSTYSVSSPINGSPFHQLQNTSTPFSGTNGSSMPLPSSVNNTSPIVRSGNSKTHHQGRSSSVGSMSMGVLKSRKKSGGGHPFDPDSTPSRLNFTYRRELEKQQHEKQLIDNLRNIIESRLKVSLPSDLSAALMDGVVLCHLVNHVRPRAVSSIHVPSPAVPKLTIPKCRLNVENFLDACRKIGVEEASLCSCDDIVTMFNPELVLTTVRSLVSPNEVTTSSQNSNPFYNCNPSSDKENLPLDIIHNNNLNASRINKKLTGVILDSKNISEAEMIIKNPSVIDQSVLSNILLCIFLTTLVLLYFFPVPN